MAPVLITGAAGFAGRWLSAACRRDGDDVVGLGLAPGPGGPDGWVSCDITDGDALDAAIVEIKPRITYHLAAIAAPALANSDQRRAWTVNLLGTLNLLAALARHSPGSTLLLASSAAVYGAVERSDCPLSESHPAAPADCYGATKRAAELAVLGGPGADLRVHVARAFNHLGPGQDADFLPGKLAARGGRHQRRPVPAPAQPGIARRLARPDRRARRRPRLPGDSRRAGSPAGYTTCARGGRFRCPTWSPASATAPVFQLKWIPTPRRPGSALPFLEGDYSRLGRDCGWRPEIALRQSVSDALARHLPDRLSNEVPDPSSNP